MMTKLRLFGRVVTLFVCLGLCGEMTPHPILFDQSEHTHQEQEGSQNASPEPSQPAASGRIFYVNVDAAMNAPSGQLSTGPPA